jgi:hypothetical protein
MSATSRRVTVKMRMVVLAPAGRRSTTTHLGYLEREGVTPAGKRGQAYDQFHDEVDLKDFERRGQVRRTGCRGRRHDSGHDDRQYPHGLICRARNEVGPRQSGAHRCSTDLRHLGRDHAARIFTRESLVSAPRQRRKPIQGYPGLAAPDTRGIRKVGFRLSCHSRLTGVPALKVTCWLVASSFRSILGCQIFTR